MFNKISFPSASITLLVDKIAGWTEMKSDKKYYFDIITTSGGIIRIDIYPWDEYNQVKCRERAECEYQDVIKNIQDKLKGA